MKHEKSEKMIGIIVVLVAIMAVIIVGLILSGSKNRELKHQLDLGQKYLTEMNYEQAVATYKQAIELDRFNTEAYLGLAEAYLGLEKYEEAEKVLEDAIIIFTQNNREEEADRLRIKLEEVQKIIDDMTVTEQTKEEEPTLDEEETKVIVMQPFVEYAGNVWGKKWTDWTVEEYISQFGLTENGSDETHRTWITPPGFPNPMPSGYREVVLWENGTYEIECLPDYVYQNQAHYIGYEKYLINYIIAPVQDEYYDFAMANGLDSVSGIVEYLMMDEETFEKCLEEGAPVSFVSDLGTCKGVFRYSNNGNGYETYDISLYDFSTNPRLTIRFDISITTEGEMHSIYVIEQPE